MISDASSLKLYLSDEMTAKARVATSSLQPYLSDKMTV